ATHRQSPAQIDFCENRCVQTSGTGATGIEECGFASITKVAVRIVPSRSFHTPLVVFILKVPSTKLEYRVLRMPPKKRPLKKKALNAVRFTYNFLSTPLAIFFLTYSPKVHPDYGMSWM